MSTEQNERLPINAHDCSDLTIPEFEGDVEEIVVIDLVTPSGSPYRPNIVNVVTPTLSPVIAFRSSPCLETIDLATPPSTPVDISSTLECDYENIELPEEDELYLYFNSLNQVHYIEERKRLVARQLVRG